MCYVSHWSVPTLLIEACETKDRNRVTTHSQHKSVTTLWTQLYLLKRPTNQGKIATNGGNRAQGGTSVQLRTQTPFAVLAVLHVLPGLIWPGLLLVPLCMYRMPYSILTHGEW